MIESHYEVIDLLGNILGCFDTLDSAEKFADNQINFCYIEWVAE